MKILVSIVSLSLSWAYFGLIYYYLKGWLKTPHHSIRDAIEPKLQVSIILPVRNEAPHIARVIESILKQKIVDGCWELIIVDDFSTDTTAAIARSYLNDAIPIRLLRLDAILDKSYAQIPNKKKAITTAVQEAKYDVIITIDGDCEYPDKWLLSMMQAYLKGHKKLITAPVTYHKGDSFWQNFLLMDMVSMIGVTCGSIGQKKPVMANGANLLFEKKVFQELNGYEGNEHIPSGDDIFLLQKIHKKYPGSIGFNKDLNAIARTSAPKTFGQFINQRIRWTSKSGKMADKKVTFILLLNYLFYLFTCLNLIILPFVDIAFLFLGILLFLIKMIVDGIFFGNILAFYKRKDLMKWLFPMEIVHLLYVTFMGFLAIFGSYSWKGRKVAK